MDTEDGAETPLSHPRSATRTAIDLDLTVVGMSMPSRGSTNPNTATPGAALQLFVSEPFNNTIEVVNLVVFGTAANQVFGPGSLVASARRH